MGLGPWDLMWSSNDRTEDRYIKLEWSNVPFTQFYYKPGSFLEIGIYGHGNWI